MSSRAYVVSLQLDAGPEALEDGTLRTRLRELEPSIHMFGRHHGKAGVMFGEVQAESETDACFKARRLWDKCEAATGLAALSCHAIRDLATEQKLAPS